MAWQFGAFFGALISGYLLFRLFKWPLGKFIPDGPLLTLAASLLAYVCAGLVQGYGMADGGPPRFAEAYADRLLPTLIVAALDILGFYWRRNKNTAPARAHSNKPLKIGEQRSLQEWHLASGETSRGPFAADEIDILLKEGKLTDDHLVWREGMADWERISDRIEFSTRPSHTKLPPPNVRAYRQGQPNYFTRHRKAIATVLVLLALTPGIIFAYSNSEKRELESTIKSFEEKALTANIFSVLQTIFSCRIRNHKGRFYQRRDGVLQIQRLYERTERRRIDISLS